MTGSTTSHGSTGGTCCSTPCSARGMAVVSSTSACGTWGGTVVSGGGGHAGSARAVTTSGATSGSVGSTTVVGVRVNAGVQGVCCLGLVGSVCALTVRGAGA